MVLEQGINLGGSDVANNCVHCSHLQYYVNKEEASAILMIDHEATVQIAKNGKLIRKKRHIECRFHFVCPGQQDGRIHKNMMLTFSPARHNFLAKLILISPRSFASSLITCFLHHLWDQRSDARGVLEICCCTVTYSSEDHLPSQHY
jgi:hypothetical protein